jgi:hypothetical protein
MGEYASSTQKSSRQHEEEKHVLKGEDPLIW